MIDDKKRPGPQPDRLQIEEEWKEAVKKALRKTKPPEGFPPEGQDDDNDDEKSMGDDT